MSSFKKELIAPDLQTLTRKIYANERGLLDHKSSHEGLTLAEKHELQRRYDITRECNFYIATRKD